MADTDVFGILSLVLAAAGAVYLVWARVLRPGAKLAAQPGASSEHDRAADTMPPALRPEAELSPKMLAKRDALTKSSRPPPPSPDMETSSVVATSGGAAATTNDPPKSSSAPAKSVKGGKSSAAKTPNRSPAAGKASEAKRSAASAKAAKPSAAPSKGAKPATKKTSFDDLDEVPRIDVEDDEDVEPTKVGRFDREAGIQPIVEKIVLDEDANKEPTDEAAPMLVVFALAQTDPGKRRKQNEDSLLVLEKESVFVVADGMGGHRGGQYASRLAVKTIGAAFEKNTFDAAPHKEIPAPASELARAMQMANSAIFHESKLRSELTGMGTTLCAARFTPDKRRLYLGHVGDSRCYRVRDGVMKQLTNDHTMADYGVAGPEGAHLSRALGVWPTVPIDMIMASPKLGDMYLLCSDGLTKMVADTTIATQLLHEEDPKAAVERLVFFANAAGGKDNITVILLRVVEPDWKPPTPAP